MKAIETERLLLRHITETDISDIYEFSRQESVGMHAGWKPHATLAETAEIAKQIFFNQELIYGIVLKENGRMVGSIGLMPDYLRCNARSRMIGYALSEAYWGKGIMTESATALIGHAFTKTDIDIISATCFTDNPRSQKVLQKCGFLLEGTIRQAEILYNQKMKDKYSFSLTKEEFLNKSHECR